MNLLCLLSPMKTSQKKKGDCDIKILKIVSSIKCSPILNVSSTIVNRLKYQISVPGNLTIGSIFYTVTRFFFFCKSQITNRRQIINVPRLFQSRRRNRKRKKFLENYPLFSRSKAHVEFESILIQQRGLERIAREREGAGVLRYRRRRECGWLRRGAAVSSN